MSVLEYEIKGKPAALKAFDASSGSGTALFSRYYVEDADGDYTKPGFLPHGAVLPLLVGHSWGEIPRGKGRIRSEPDAAYFDFTLADTHAGRELAEWLRFDAADGQPKSEFSYGFKVLEGGSSHEIIDGKRLRVLHSRADGSAGCQALEVSYVLKGAGVSTALISAKSAERYHWDKRYAELTRAIKARDAAFQAEAREMYEKLLQRQREITQWRGW